jgi:hypothetical protein
MIVVVGQVQTDAGKRDALIRICQAVAAASRAEEGCISYRLYEDTELENAAAVQDTRSPSASVAIVCSGHTVGYEVGDSAPIYCLRARSRSPGRSCSSCATT